MGINKRNIKTLERKIKQKKGVKDFVVISQNFETKECWLHDSQKIYKNTDELCKAEGIDEENKIVLIFYGTKPIKQIAD